MVEFVVRVPEMTPPESSVFVAGDGPLLGEWHADRTTLELLEDGTYRTRLDLPVGFRGRFLVTLGHWRDAENDGRGGELAPRELHFDRQRRVEVNVSGWGRECVRYYHDFSSRFLPHPRTISVWLPPGYDLAPAQRYPVLYMQDGQNLFDAETAFAGNPWRADEIAEREVRGGRVQPLLIVGIANTVDRIREYGPRQFEENGEDRSRDYGRFVVEEVKPFIDATYRTLPGAEHAGVGGSSMGGLISLHLCQWYPDVFRHCAALSPSLWWDREFFLRTMADSPEWLERCRVWADMGTREGASEAGMKAMSRRVRRLAEHFKQRELREEERFHFEEVEGGMHNETAWGGRFDRVLRFLFGSED
jgi:predicted alpha/beta superfamily hydrolase